MSNKSLSPVVLMLFAIASCGSAVAAEQTVGCRLKGGSLVQLAAETCAMEGGTPVTAVAPDATTAAAQFSDDPGLAAAQRTIVALLNKPVVDKDMEKRTPEGIERTAQFDGCRLLVEESMHVDYGNALSARMNFKIVSSVDLHNISRDAFGVLGKVTSYGGGLKTYAVYFDERKRGDGNNIAIAVTEQRKDGPRSFTLPGSAAFWDAPHDDLWMLDGYGYPKDNSSGFVATDRIRILFMLNTVDDADALKKALDDAHALCKP